MRKLQRYINLDLSKQNFAYIVTRAKYDFRSVAAFLLLLAVCWLTIAPRSTYPICSIQSRNIASNFCVWHLSLNTIHIGHPATKLLRQCLCVGALHFDTLVNLARKYIQDFVDAHKLSIVLYLSWMTLSKNNNSIVYIKAIFVSGNQE